MTGMVTRNALRNSNAPERADASRPWALIVAPDPVHEPVYALVLAQMDVDCVCTSSAQDANSVLARPRCIGIFLDRSIKQTSGLETAKRIRDTSAFESTPIVFVSDAPVDEIDATRGSNIGVVDYLPLPLDKGILRQKVSLLLELHRQQLEIEELRSQLVLPYSRDARRNGAGDQAQSRSVPQETRDPYRSNFEHPTLLSIVLQAVRAQDGRVVDWIYADANQNVLRILNRTREALFGKRLSEVVPDRAERLFGLCAQVLTTQQPVHYESHFDSQDFLICLFPAGPDSIISSGINVTARNRAEREVHRLLEDLGAEKEWLLAVLSSINDEVYFTDPQGRYTYANPAALREFGHASLSGVPVETVVSDLVVLRADGTPRAPQEAPPLRALAGEVIKNEGQVVRIPRTGEFRHREVSSAPVRNAEGHIIGAVSVARDVTETKQVEARLRVAVDQARVAEAESRATLAAELVAMQRLHDLSTEAMTTNDLDALLETILDATIALHDARSGSVQLLDAEGKTLRISAQRGMHQEALERFAEVNASTRSVCGLALARRERVIVEDVESDPGHTLDPDVARRVGLRAVQSTPLFTADGAILGMVSTHFRSPRAFSQNELRLTDLYARQAGIAIERKRAEAAVAAAHEAAEVANKAKSHFVRAASHDLRQSVQTLALLNGTLRNSALSASGRSALGQQSEAIDTMMHLLDALLNISKLESGAVAPEIADFSVTALFEKLRMEFSSHAEDKGLELKIDAPMAQAIHSDATLVGEILRNFLSNAIKFTAQGTITLRSSRVGSTARLEVVDTGIGIPHEELPLIFGEFYQVGVSATLNRRGYGLGLGIAQRIAMLLQADIQVDSKVGKGSVFSLDVPEGALAPAVRTEQISRQRINNEASSTLLLVEDDASVRASMQLFFRSHGYRVVSAASLDQALTIVGTMPRPDVLITDFHLPDGKTGSDVIRSIRDTLGESLPAILISGDTSAEIEDLSHDAGVRFASKPIDPDCLVALVQELVVQSAAVEAAN